MPYSTNNLHSVFYENNKQNNLNSNFFFQIFGVQKQIEKTTKFYSNTSGNSSTLQAANTVRKKDEFSEITERTVYPKKLLQSRDEFLNRKTKAVSSLNFFHQCSKPNASENKNDRQSYHYGLVQNPSLKNPLNEFLFQNRSKKIFCLKDLTDV